MQVTIFSVWMAILWSSFLIVVFYLLRVKMVLLDLCSVPGVIVLYLFCLIRMMVPIEFSWTKVISAQWLYNKIYGAFYYKTAIGIELYVWQMLLLVWLLGGVILMIRLAVRYRKAAKYFNSLKLTDNVLAINAAKKVTGGKKLDIVQTPAVRTPCCMGEFHKRVLIPEKPYSEEEMYYIIFHEYIHLQNNDFFIKMLVHILCAAYWWNPFVYLLKKDLNQSMEIRCDCMVTQGMDRQEKAGYLAVMLKEFKSSQGMIQERGQEGMIAEFLGDGSDKLIERFNLVADHQRHPVNRGKLSAWVIAAGLLVLSYSFVLQTKYDVSKTAIEMDQDTYEVFNEKFYIYKKRDGSCVLRSLNEDIPIGEESVKVLMQDGFKMVEGL